MEPRPHERGNPFRNALVRRIRMLQWSHVLTNVETWDARRIGAVPFTLQWSHVLTNVETIAIGGCVGISKQQLQWSHVLTNVETAHRDRARFPDRACFNGATSSRTWKQLANQRIVSGVNAASMEPRPHERGNRRLASAVFSYSSFNGATSSRTWKRFRRGREDAKRKASMEPRPHERGNV